MLNGEGLVCMMVDEKKAKDYVYRLATL